MKFEHHSDTSGWSFLRATPIDFDGTPPVERLRWRWPHATASADRVTVAAALAFSPWVAGRLDFPSQFSALTAQRTQEWFSDHIWVSPTTVRAGALPIPPGHRSMIIGEQDPAVDVSLLFSRPAESTAIARDRIRLATNVAFFEIDGHPRARLLAELALAVLTAEHLAVGVIRHPHLAELDPVLLGRTARWLESVSLGLTP